MAKTSAGILVYRWHKNGPELLLVHPGGPFFARKDKGAWTIPKGELAEDEAPLAAAKREFREELGLQITGDPIPLAPVTQKGGKKVLAWAIKQDIDISSYQSNTFQMEWPPASGKLQEFPEVDKAEWFSVDIAKEKINPAQVAFIEELLEKLAHP
ncbi:MAG: NUDIX hydrolase [Bacteroidetes bacterium 46-16]|nr:MAG: NUDIX hydrolase [Bacteroidetes bacterium 46-16]